MSDVQGPADPAADPTDDGVDQGKGRNLQAPSEQEYERWWKEYRAGARSPAKLARIARASIHRIRHAVRVGWPERGFPALKDRAEHSDAAVAAATQKVAAESEVKAAEVVARVIAGSWEDAARMQLSAIATTTDALSKLGERLAQAAAQASFVSYRRVPDKDAKTGEIRRDKNGNPITILKEHVSAYTVAAAASRLTAAAKEHAALSKALLSSIAPGGMQQVLAGPPAVVLYLPDDGTAPARPAPPVGTDAAG